MAALALAGLADVNHIVTPGESLWSIARRYATTPTAIAGANHLPNPDLIQIGLALRIPGALVMPASASGGNGGNVAGGRPAPPVLPRTGMTHTVAAGESLTAIASHFGVSPQALSALNGMAHPNLVHIGQVLRVPVAPPTTVGALLVHYATAYNVDPVLMKALAWQESGWQQSVVSPVGAVGVMQIMPQTSQFTALNLLRQPVNPTSVESNVQAGVAFFAYLLGQAHGNSQLAVAGYYQGLRSVQTRGMYGETKRYVANIEALKQRFRH
ncbi:MAG: hypothetical protein NVSMB32_07010 [Actinomycetota bacterium]